MMRTPSKILDSAKAKVDKAAKKDAIAEARAAEKGAKGAVKEAEQALKAANKEYVKASTYLAKLLK